MMLSIGFTAEMAQVRQAVEDHLVFAFDRYPATEVREAAQYAILGGGRRWRAIMAVAAGRIFRKDALEMVLPAACGTELAHAASLVLDDLPSMDDAQVRRGRPCTHRMFRSSAVDMTPVFLVTMAYQVSLDNPRVPAERRVRAALELSAAGMQMIAGQVKDMEQEHARSRDGQHLLDCYRLKSGTLFAAAIKCGGLLCGANEQEVQSLYLAGLNFGLSFQLLDDIADVAAGASEIGKNRGMDFGKWTAVDWLGVEGAERKSVEFQSRSLAALKEFGSDAEWLRALICEVSLRSELACGAPKA
jgi:geranylgeranyl diphosphate synthase, type II